MTKLPKPGKPKTLKKPATAHRSPVKKLTTAARNSHIEAHNYNPETGHLDVTFSGGRKYRYENVSKQTAGGIADAASLGQYLHAHVIGKHEVKKI